MDQPVFTSSSGNFATARRGGFDAYELAFIEEKLAAGVPASGIARMLGRNVNDVASRVRALTTPLEAVEPSEDAPKGKPFKVGLRPPPPPDEPTILLSLWRGLIAVPPPKPTMAGIAAEVAQRYDISLEDLLGRSHAKRCTIPRQEAMWRMVQAKRWSLPEVGRYFDRDHTTVIHACRAHEKRMAEVKAKHEAEGEPSEDLSAWRNLGQPKPREWKAWTPRKARQP
jgi:hypothetical protein